MCNESLDDDQEKVRERINKYTDLFPELLDSIEKDHPEWEFETLIWVLSWSLDSLRHYIELESENSISWEDPFVELQFPVECKWDPSINSETPSFTLTCGHITENDVKDKETAIKALTKLVIRYLEVVTFQRLTNHSALAKKGDEHFAILSQEYDSALGSISDEKERQVLVDALLQPISFGAGTVDFGDLDLGNKEASKISQSALEQIQEIREPLVSVNLTLDAIPIRVVTIFELQPFHVNLETRKGYFPIVVGLAIQPDFGDSYVASVDWLERKEACFSRWEEHDRNKIWAFLEDSINQLLKELSSSAKADVEEAIISVNADIKVVAPSDGEGGITSLASDITSKLGDVGDVIKIGFDSKQSPDIERFGNPSMLEHLELFESLTDKREKGEALEFLIEQVFNSVEGFRVRRNIRTETEEIDLWIDNDCTRAPFRHEKDVVLVECKNWKASVGKNEFVAFREKILNRKCRCTIGFLVSWNGFAETISKEMVRGSREEILIVPVTGADIRSAIQKGNFFNLLSDLRARALMF